MKQPRFNLRLLMLIVSLFAVGFATVGAVARRRTLDADARRMSLQGRLHSLELLRKSYDDMQVLQSQRFYLDVKKEAAEAQRQLKKLDD